MKKQLISFTLVAAGFLLGATALSALAQTSGTWTAPTAVPPSGNIAAPINAGPTAQAKTGLLGLSSFQFDPGGSSTITPGSVLTAADNQGTVEWAPSSGSGSGSGFIVPSCSASGGSAGPCPSAPVTGQMWLVLP